MGYYSRRPQWVRQLSAKNRKLRPQFALAHRNWTTEEWDVVIREIPIMDLQLTNLQQSDMNQETLTKISDEIFHLGHE